MTFSPIVSDRFEEEEVLAMLSYLLNPDSADENAVNLFNESGTIMDTYRPCYASLKCEEIRGRLRVFIHLTIEGKALPVTNMEQALSAAISALRRLPTLLLQSAVSRILQSEAMQSPPLKERKDSF